MRNEVGRRGAGIAEITSRDGAKALAAWWLVEPGRNDAAAPSCECEMLPAVDTDDVSCSRRRPVDEPQSPDEQPALAATVDRRLCGGGEVVEDDRHTRPEKPGKVNVEQAEVADDDHVHVPGRAGTPDQLQPAADEGEHELVRIPRLTQHLDALVRREAKRLVADDDLVAVRAKAFFEHRDPLVDRRVIGPEEQHPATPRCPSLTLFQAPDATHRSSSTTV